uniref:Uncharacterized protein n=1 Tax=Branchiostoma floridae TaxID=7739 RepID=C3Z192_BRAFL|eukprot:XP_002597779.1 hypothetical protein BRAFLDRAFT_77318 [Branchiostoma floridae]
MADKKHNVYSSRRIIRLNKAYKVLERLLQGDEHKYRKWTHHTTLHEAFTTISQLMQEIRMISPETVPVKMIEITTDAEIGALETMAKNKPGARVWFEADACDLKVAFQTSMKDKWSGDVDLGDGSVQKMYSECQRRLALVKEAGQLSDRGRLVKYFCTLLVDMAEARGLTAANDKYEAMFHQPDVNSYVEKLKMLAWERIEYNTLL